jgi:hexosaminidase
VHRALEAFAQLTIRLGDAIVINSTRVFVEASPSFTYRGLMIDTARHYEPVPALLQLLDGMAASSLNVFHWHLTDAQAFPWNSTAEPRLVQGAYREDLTYQRSDLELIVAHASDRAIRVIVEIDMPGHAASWAVGRPDVVVDCKPDNSDPL